MSFFNKVSNLYSLGKQKIKDKLHKNNNNNNTKNQTMTMKVGASTNSNKASTQKTKITPVKERRDEDIFKIEEDDGGKEFTYKIQDIDSEEEEEDEIEEGGENPENSKQKKEYIMVDEKINSSDNERLENNNLSENKNYSTSTSTGNVSSMLSEIGKNEDDDDLAEYLSFENQDIYTISHRLILKGSLIDISDNFVIPCLRIKQKNKLFSMVGLSKEKISVDYLLFFDENYMYPIKNIPLQKDCFLRKVGNKYDLRLIRNISIKHNNNHYLITLEFLTSVFSQDKKTKVYELNVYNARKLTELLNLYLTKLGMELDNEHHVLNEVNNNNLNQEINNQDNEDPQNNDNQREKQISQTERVMSNNNQNNDEEYEHNETI